MPKNKDFAERRNHSRCGDLVQIHPTSVFGPNSMVENISLGGMRIQSQKSFSPGDTLQIQLSLVDADWVEANVRVVWINEQNQEVSPRFDIGFEFVDMPFDMQNELWVLLDKNTRSH